MLGYRIVSAKMLSSFISASGRIVPTHAETHKYAENTFSHKGNKCFWFFDNIEDAKAVFNVFADHSQENYIMEFSFEESDIIERGKGYYWGYPVNEFITMSIIPDNITGKIWACVDEFYMYSEEGGNIEYEFAKV